MELLQESQVCAVEQTNIIHAVAHHYQSVKTDIHIESGKFIRIKTCCAEYIRVRRTAGHYLYPSDMLANAAALAAAYKTAHIYLKAGFNKGEEAGAHPYGYITAENLLNRCYQSHLSRLKYANVNSVTGRQGIHNMGRNIIFKLVVPVNIL